MGLTIKAYSNLKEVLDVKRDKYGELENYELLDISQLLIDYTEKHFEGRTSGLKVGAYEYQESLDFEAGSYIRYGIFREELKKIVSNSRQLYELIMFFDNEGVIGSFVSKKLAQDFNDLEEKAEIELSEEHFEKFLEFKEAFELAAEDGCVLFW